MLSKASNSVKDTKAAPKNPRLAPLNPRHLASAHSHCAVDADFATTPLLPSDVPRAVPPVPHALPAVSQTAPGVPLAAPPVCHCPSAPKVKVLSCDPSAVQAEAEVSEAQQRTLSNSGRRQDANHPRTAPETAQWPRNSLRLQPQYPVQARARQRVKRQGMQQRWHLAQQRHLLIQAASRSAPIAAWPTALPPSKPTARVPPWLDLTVRASEAAGSLQLRV